MLLLDDLENDFFDNLVDIENILLVVVSVLENLRLF